MYKNILILCFANICRSPLAEVMLVATSTQQNLGLNVASAGLQALVGEPAHPYSIEVAESHHLDLSQHQAHQVDSALVQWADLILVMEHGQRKLLTNLFPESSGKAFLIGEFARIEIPDPYQQPLSTFHHTYELLASCLEQWIHHFQA